MNTKLSARAADAPSEPSEPSFHVIVDETGYPEFVTKLRQAAQEHINDACAVSVEGAGKWKSIPVFEKQPANQSKPAAWIDQFGNVFPLGAYQPSGKPSYLDAEKRGWKPLFRAADALDSQPTEPSADDLPLFDRDTTEDDYGVINLAATYSVARQFGREFSESSLLAFIDALASSQPTDPDGLPPLPDPIEAGGEGWDFEDFKSEKTFSCEHMWAYARKAVAADRAKSCHVPPLANDAEEDYELAVQRGWNNARQWVIDSRALASSQPTESPWTAYRRRFNDGQAASQPTVAAQQGSIADADRRDAMRGLVSDFRKATYEFGKRHDPEDHALMLRLQRQLVIELDAIDSRASSAPVAPIAPDGWKRKISDAEIAAWADRYDIANMLGSTARAAFEDAQTLHMTQQEGSEAGK
jgi:hypothetical protein